MTDNNNTFSEWLIRNSMLQTKYRAYKNKLTSTVPRELIDNYSLDINNLRIIPARSLFLENFDIYGPIEKKVLFSKDKEYISYLAGMANGLDRLIRIGFNSIGWDEYFNSSNIDYINKIRKNTYDIYILLKYSPIRVSIVEFEGISFYKYEYGCLYDLILFIIKNRLEGLIPVYVTNNNTLEQ